MATQPLAPELANRRGDLLADTIREIHDPTTVDQKHRNTCGAATIQSYMAASHPAEFARLVAGLATPGGEVAMQNGGILRRDANFMDGSDEGRSLSGRLLEPPLMSKAGIGTYDNSKDGTVIPIPGLDLSIPGMIPEGMASVLTDLTGEHQTTTWNTPGFPNHAYENGTPTHPAPVLVNYPDHPGEVAPHWISVTNVDQAHGTVTYRNPWGREETVSQQEFDRHVYAVVHPGGMPNPFPNNPFFA
jgi:hypothetical protein